MGSISPMTRCSSGERSCTPTRSVTVSETNYLELPINQPRTRPATNQRDGQMAYALDATGQNPDINFKPDSTGGPREAERSGPDYEPEISGRLVRATLKRINDFAQAGERYRSMPDAEREDLVGNMIALLGQCERQIQDRMVTLFAQCDADYAARVADGLGIPSPLEATPA